MDRDLQIERMMTAKERLVQRAEKQVSQPEVRRVLDDTHAKLRRIREERRRSARAYA